MGIAGSLKRGVSLISDAFAGGMRGGRGDYLVVLRYRVVSFLAMLAGPALAALCISILFIWFRGALGDVAVFLLSVLLGIGGIVLGNTYYNAANFAATEYVYSGKRGRYFEGENVRVAFRWALFKAAAVVLLAIPLGLLAAAAIFVLGEGAAVEVLSAAAVALSIPIGLLLYYVGQEFAIHKRGPVEAIRASFGLAKGNFWETTLAASAFSLGANALYAVPMALFYAGAGVSAGMMLAGGESYPMGAALAISCIAGIAVVLTIVESGMLIMQVGLYRGITGARKRKAF